MLITAYSLNALLMFLIPIFLGIFLARKYQLSWRLFLFGGVAFILAQLFHLPLNALLTRIVPGLGADGNIWVQAITLGFTAAITEELARYSILRNNLKEARSWKQALMFGAGHGGFEAMILGILAALTLVNMIVIKNNPHSLDSLATLDPQKLALVQQQVAAFWSAPWYLTLMGAVERVSALTIQVSLAVIVMQVFLRKNTHWLWLAVGWHWFVDAVSVLSAARFSIPITELIIGVLAVTSLTLIFYLRPIEPEEADQASPEPPAPVPLDDLHFNPSPDSLDDSRYTPS